MYHKAWSQSPPVFIRSDGTFVSNFVFKRFHTKPLLDKQSAVVGARNIDESTGKEISALFERTANKVLQYRKQLQLVTKKIAGNVSSLLSNSVSGKQGITMGRKVTFNEEVILYQQVLGTIFMGKKKRLFSQNRKYNEEILRFNKNEHS